MNYVMGKSDEKCCGFLGPACGFLVLAERQYCTCFTLLKVALLKLKLEILLLLKKLKLIY